MLVPVLELVLVLDLALALALPSLSLQSGVCSRSSQLLCIQCLHGMQW